MAIDAINPQAPARPGRSSACRDRRVDAHATFPNNQLKVSTTENPNPGPIILYLAERSIPYFIRTGACSCYVLLTYGLTLIRPSSPGVWSWDQFPFVLHIFIRPIVQIITEDAEPLTEYKQANNTQQVQLPLINRTAVSCLATVAVYLSLKHPKSLPVHTSRTLKHLALRVRSSGISLQIAALFVPTSSVLSINTRTPAFELPL